CRPRTDVRVRHSDRPEPPRRRPSSAQCNMDRVDARYRLAPMHEARTRDERVKRGDLASAVRDALTLATGVDASARQVARYRTQIAAAHAHRDQLLERGATVATLARLDRYVLRLRHALDAARGEQLRAEARHRGQLAAVDQARGRLLLARADREIIERHFATWRAERRKLAERRDD